MCLYPRLLKNRKYTKTKKNKGIIPLIPDERVKYVPIGCQKCIECRKQYSRGWQTRLLEDIKTNTNGKFITLTFSNESILKLSNEIKNAEGYELDNAIATLAVRRFLERWRKTYKRSLRHWLVTELGHKGTENIHLHGIIWTEHSYELLRQYWGYGYVWPKKETNIKTYVNERTVNYITKYITKLDNDHKYYKAKILTSPGIGHNYTANPDSKKNIFKKIDTNTTYRTNTGHNIALPIYWRNKLYTEEERELLWIQKLDKNERWVCGEKIDLNKRPYSDYENLIKFHRKRNKQLGYGDDEKNWDEELYEREKRKILIETRKNNAFGEKYSKGYGYINLQQ